MPPLDRAALDESRNVAWAKFRRNLDIAPGCEIPTRAIYDAGFAAGFLAVLALMETKFLVQSMTDPRD